MLLFTPSQLEVIEHEIGPAKVDTGPGSGKTRTLTERIARLAEKGLAWHRDVLTLTFANKDAGELRTRIQERLSVDAEDVQAYTFHAFGKMLLTSEHAAKGSEKQLRIFDPEASFRLIDRAMRDLNINQAVWSPRMVASVITDAKERGIAPEYYLQIDQSPQQRTLGQIYEHYQEFLEAQGGYDFADLVIRALALLEAQPDLLGQIHQQYKFIQVDEFQDASPRQFELVKALVGPQANLLVVGSGAQSIYEWRQANYVELRLQFDATFPNAKVFVLHENFRSTPQITTASHALFFDSRQTYTDIELISMRAEGTPVRDVRVASDQDEAIFIGNEIRRLHDEVAIPWNEIAVLYRLNAQNRLIEQECIRQHIPYSISGGRRLYQRREVRDMLDYLDIALSGSEAGLARIVNSPPRGLGRNALRDIKGDTPNLTWDDLVKAMSGDVPGLNTRTVEAISNFYDLLMDLSGQASAKPAEAMKYIFEKSGYLGWLLREFDGTPKIAVIEELIAEAEEFETLPEFLTAIRNKITAMEEMPENGITLSTIHSVKGLEFQAVFVAGIEERLLPHYKSDSESERRLAYVAMTRAKDYLYLLSVAQRDLRGQLTMMRPSRFLYEVAAYVQQETI